LSPESPPEFHRYRLTVRALVFALTGTAVVWLASSVGVALWIHPRPAPGVFSGAADDVAGMLRCQGELESLFADLERLMGQLVGGAAAPAPGETPETLRQEFAEGWRARWRAVGASCRFAALRDRGLGAAYDHQAWVHARLDELHRAYGALLETYQAHQEPRVQDIRRALETSRQTLERKRAPGASSTG
jgi:hypothetical protein